MRRVYGRLALALAFVGAVVAIGVGPAAGAAKVFVGCGDYVSTNLTLTADLNCALSDSNGLNVDSSGITINLNGHSIIGGGGAQGWDGIEIDGYSDVQIVNGTIMNFTRGVDVVDSYNPEVENVNFVLDGVFDVECNDLYGVVLDFTFKANVTGNTFDNTGDTSGEGCDTYGIYTAESLAGNYSNNTASHMAYSYYDWRGAYDTWVKDVSNGVLDETTGFTDYYGGSFFVDGGSFASTLKAKTTVFFVGVGNTYIKDTANGGYDGFYLYEDGDGYLTLKNSTANGNSHDGAYMYAAFSEITCDGSCKGSTVSGNSFGANGNDGMHGAYNGFMKFSKNKATLNGFNPDCCGEHGDGFNFYNAFDATFTKNTASNNYNDGFRLHFWQDAVAKQNVSNNNDDDGFDLGGNDVCEGSFTKNKAFGNSDWGAFASNFFVPGTGNKTDSGFNNVNIASHC